MILRINGMRAVLKRGSSFEYVSENRFFTDADAYTLAIELPLKDCPQNLEIFGHINRKDVSKGTGLMACELRTGTFVKRGSVAITEINDVFVKVQFLEGRSAQNCAADFDSVYINELNLGYNTYLDYEGEPTAYTRSKWPVSKMGNTLANGQIWQALPWVNNYSGNIQNELEFANGTASYKPTTFGELSFQCYLYSVTTMIFDAVGYTYNLEVWLNSPYRYLLCCNTLPAAWEVLNYAMSLPHWSLTEYIEQLELLMYCEFDINHTNKSIRMQFSHSAIEKAGTVMLEKVVDEYTVSQEDESSSKYKDMTNLRYAECDHELWKFYDCQWLIDKAKNYGRDERWLNYVECSSISQLMQKIPSTTSCRAYNPDLARCSQEQNVYYVKSIDRYFVARRTAITMVESGSSATDTEPAHSPLYEISLSIQAVNLCKPAIADPNAETAELKIVPAWLDDLGDSSKGLLIFLDCGEYDNEQAFTVKTLLDRGESTQEQFFDKIYVAFWTGEQVTTKYPHPFLDSIDIDTDRQQKTHAGYSLALRDPASYGYRKAPTINRAYKYSFSFLSDEVPDVRSNFIIQGRKYVCEKITATFTEEGMSQLMKGDFYEII